VWGGQDKVSTPWHIGREGEKMRVGDSRIRLTRATSLSSEMGVNGV
jgi:hypothetical protein